MSKSTQPETAVFSFTESAKAMIKQMNSEMQVPEDYYLRVGMQGAGCGGMSYLLGFDSRKPEDQLYEVDGIPLIMDPRHSMYLLGMEIDYLSEADRSGFVFNNPGAKASE